MVCTNDERVRSILINPRLHGLPHARTFSAVLFIIIIGINVVLAIILSEANAKINNVAVNVLSAKNFTSEGCESVEYAERVGYNFRSPFLTRASKAFLSIDIEDPQELAIEDHLLREDQLADILAACRDSDYSIGSDVLENYCLAGIASPLGANEEVNSEIVFRRQQNDIFVELEASPGVIYRIYTTPVDEPSGNYNINVVVSSSNFNYDITAIPAFLEQGSAIEDLNEITADILVAIGSRSGTNDFLLVSLTTRFANCEQRSGLNSFEYFALLFDYAFIIEGFFTVFVALAILRCLGYDIYDSKGKIVRSSRRGKQEFEVKPVQEILELKNEVEVKEIEKGEAKKKAEEVEEEQQPVEEEEKPVEDEKKEEETAPVPKKKGSQEGEVEVDTDML